MFADQADARKIDPVLNKFTAHFEPRRCEVYERFKFLKRHQLPDETFDTWLIELRSLVKTCNYSAVVDSFLRDMIVLGVADHLVRKKLLYEKDLLFPSLNSLSSLPHLSTLPMLFKLVRRTRSTKTSRHSSRPPAPCLRAVQAINAQRPPLTASNSRFATVVAVDTRRINVVHSTFAAMVAVCLVISLTATPIRTPAANSPAKIRPIQQPRVVSMQ